MFFIRLILALLFLIFAAYIVVMNWGCVLASRRNKKRGIDKSHSTVSIVSLFLAAIAYITYPLEHKLWFFLIPLLDIANWMLVLLSLALIKGLRSKKSAEALKPDTQQKQ